MSIITIAMSAQAAAPQPNARCQRMRSTLLFDQSHE